MKWDQNWENEKEHANSQPSLGPKSSSEYCIDSKYPKSQ